MQFIFVDESGDPGRFNKIVGAKKIPTGASRFYIITAIPVDSEQLFKLEREMIKIKHRYKFQNEMKSTTIPLTMYAEKISPVPKWSLTGRKEDC